MIPPPARHACTDPGLARVEEGDPTVFSDRLVHRVELRGVGEEGLRVGVELEPLNVVLVDQPVDFVDGALAKMRVDAAECDQRVRVVDSGLGDFVIRYRRHTHRGRAVDREHDRHHLPRSVVLSHLSDGRTMNVSAGEVLVGRIHQLRRQCPAAGDCGDLHMGVNVDRNQRLDINFGHDTRMPDNASTRIAQAA